MCSVWWEARIYGAHHVWFTVSPCQRTNMCASSLKLGRIQLLLMTDLSLRNQGPHVLSQCDFIVCCFLPLFFLRFPWDGSPVELGFAHMSMYRTPSANATSPFQNKSNSDHSFYQQTFSVFLTKKLAQRKIFNKNLTDFKTQ